MTSWRQLLPNSESRRRSTAAATKLLGGRWSLRDYPNGDCVYLDPRRGGARSITHAQCSAERGRSGRRILPRQEAWKRTCEICPGSGTGQLHSLSVIQLQAAACDI